MLDKMTVRAPFEGTASPVRAAQYVRMSTEHQKYSTENQIAVIAAYAAERGYSIVHTYADEGRSGLKLEGRAALKQLIADVRHGRASYSAILVYDVSRWGRFQDADESAYYEYLCREAGIAIHYCAEQFDNDGSLASTIIKSMKRAMAGEYSRELSAKVFRGQCHLVSLGFRQGGSPGYGLRRQLIDDKGNYKAELGPGEYKSLQTDRVILRPGPDEEQQVVQQIYRLFVLQLKREEEIAVTLNDEGISNEFGRPWSRGTVHQVLTNEKYIGNNVYNRISFKLKQKRVSNPPDLWVRCPNAFEGLVELDFFQAAKRIIDERSKRLSDDEMLERLSSLYTSAGYLSGLTIDERDDMPSTSAYRTRFGSLLRAYHLVGFHPTRDYRYIQINRKLRSMHPDIVSMALERIEGVGGEVTVNSINDILTINGEFTASIVLVRCCRMQSGGLRWKVRFDTSLLPDITIVLRMNEANDSVMDYYLLPRIDLAENTFRLREDNSIQFDAYRFDTLDTLLNLSSRGELRYAA
ncbi:recombinase family protein [Bradyrhizobium sp. SYSU BS000235]|uniref:recombinase family protein n=1 Tax=Bradyrhizobium sp. SYSU BS000235 TaxID=3411332 RepID=UPI003C76A0B8